MSHFLQSLLFLQRNLGENLFAEGAEDECVKVLLDFLGTRNKW